MPDYLVTIVQNCSNPNYSLSVVEIGTPAETKVVSPDGLLSLLDDIGEDEFHLEINEETGHLEVYKFFTSSKSIDVKQYA